MKVIKKGLDLMSDEEQDRVGELQIKPSKEEVKEPCRESSTDNPYQNILWDNDGLKSCKTDKLKQQENFEENLYRNETDLFDRKSMQGFYYTVEDSYPNKINDFLKLMDSNGRCKDDNVNCKYPSFFLQ